MGRWAWSDSITVGRLFRSKSTLLIHSVFKNRWESLGISKHLEVADFVENSIQINWRFGRKLNFRTEPSLLNCLRMAKEAWRIAKELKRIAHTAREPQSENYRNRKREEMKKIKSWRHFKVKKEKEELAAAVAAVGWAVTQDIRKKTGERCKRGK